MKRSLGPLNCLCICKLVVIQYMWYMMFFDHKRDMSHISTVLHQWYFTEYCDSVIFQQTLSRWLVGALLVVELTLHTTAQILDERYTQEIHLLQVQTTPTGKNKQYSIVSKPFSISFFFSYIYIDDRALFYTFLCCAPITNILVIVIICMFLDIFKRTYAIM